VLNFSRTYVRRGFHSRPMTRDLDWGMPTPPPGWDTKCLYVWFEALPGYISASIEWAGTTGQPEAWKAWWYNPAARLCNFLGKDNIPFHTVCERRRSRGTVGARPLAIRRDRAFQVGQFLTRQQADPA
jgi:methionyl-tRNA synthetase